MSTSLPSHRSSDDGGLIALGKDELKEMNVQTMSQVWASGAGGRAPVLRSVSHPQHKTKYSSIEFSNEMQIDHVRVPVIARSVGQWQPKHFC